MTKRRYGEDEVREIFSLARTGSMRDRSLPTESGGLTLDEPTERGEQMQAIAEHAVKLLSNS